MTKTGCSGCSSAHSPSWSSMRCGRTSWLPLCCMPLPKDSPTRTTTATTTEDAGEDADDGAGGKPCCLLPHGLPDLLIGRIMGWWVLRVWALAILVLSCESPILTSAGVICLN